MSSPVLCRFLCASLVKRLLLRPRIQGTSEVEPSSVPFELEAASRLHVAGGCIQLIADSSGVGGEGACHGPFCFCARISRHHSLTANNISNKLHKALHMTTVIDCKWVGAGPAVYLLPT